MVAEIYDYATLTQGTRMAYDGLDRVIRVEQDSELTAVRRVKTRPMN
ncbi:hypothetical protein GCM10027432_13410 [Lysobacter fragariae]